MSNFRSHFSRASSHRFSSRGGQRSETSQERPQKSQKRRLPSDNDSDADSNADDNPRLHKRVATTTAWDGTRRREKAPSSEGHVEAMKHCSKLLLAKVFSGAGKFEFAQEDADPCDPWANANETFLSNMIFQCWRHVRDRRTEHHINENLRIDLDPTPVEARKVSYFSKRGNRG